MNDGESGSIINANTGSSAEINTMPEAYVVVDGPEGLSKMLENFLHKCQQDEDFAKTGHYILYRLGDQKSLIKVDMSKPPYKFYYYDLLGRPITHAVKNTIVRFLWEKCGLKEVYNNEGLEE